jgi:hypothetical protein
VKIQCDGLEEKHEELRNDRSALFVAAD